ncbi:MAG TPA: hypothetical protein VM513_10900 [Kofleriaceae bacterium]|jgi:hypothetical protein|nr:hypothetical protein [Kofleriaceae bacterium]
MNYKVTGPLLGSLVLVAACTDPAPETETDEALARVATRATECRGEAVAPAALSARLAIDPAAGIATITIENHTTAGHFPEAKLSGRKSGGEQARSPSGSVYVAPGGSGVVRFSLSSLALDPTMPEQLVAEVTLRDAAGGIAERTFAHAAIGPSVAETAARLGIPMTSKQSQLAAIARGGSSADISSFAPTHDAIDDIAASPTLPLPSFTYDMCFRWPVTLVDAGFGEDYGTDPTSPWIARGGRVSIVQNAKTVFDGYLDANGCTGAFKATSSVNFSIFGYSRARVANNEIIARNAEGKQVSFVIWDADPGMNQHPVYVFPEVAPVTTMLAVGAYTMQKFHGGMTGKTLPIEHRCNPAPGGCCDCAQDGGIWISDFGADKKFLIAHEMGHRILSLYAGGYDNDVDYDLDPNDNITTCDTSSSHALWSMEYDSGAAMEGWAHFLAAATFNDRAGDNPGAMFRYWSSTNTIDVEQSSPGFPSNYLDTVCSQVVAANTVKVGVELDWLRHYWDYYTNALDVDPGARPTVKQMMAEIEAAPFWSRGTAWSSIRQGVSSYSGAAQLDRWDQHGAWNGVD